MTTKKATKPCLQCGKEIELKKKLGGIYINMK